MYYNPTTSEIILIKPVAFCLRMQGYSGTTITGFSCSAWYCIVPPFGGYDSAYNFGSYNGKFQSQASANPSYFAINCGSSSFVFTSPGSFVYTYFVAPISGIYHFDLDFGQLSSSAAGIRVVIGMYIGTSTSVGTEIIDYQAGSVAVMNGLDQINYSCTIQVASGQYVFPYAVTTPTFSVGNFSGYLICPTY